MVLGIKRSYGYDWLEKLIHWKLSKRLKKITNADDVEPIWDHEKIIRNTV